MLKRDLQIGELVYSAGTAMTVHDKAGRDLIEQGAAMEQRGPEEGVIALESPC